MDIFFSLLTSILPLYVMIALGWVAGRFYGVDRESLSGVAIFIFVPAVAFYYVAGLEFKLAYTALPFIIWGIYSLITLAFYQIGKKIYPDKRANLLAICASSSNTGYLGLPIAILLLPFEWVGVYVFAMLGGLIYEATLMYYIANRGNFSPKESITRVLKFPVIYAILAGLALNFSGIDLPKQIIPYLDYFKGAYVVVGMMIIGVSLSKVSKLVTTTKFLSLVFFGQFIIWPLVAFAVIALDRHVFHGFGPDIYKILMIMAIVPPAANIAAFAAKLDLNPEKAATTVLLGTLFALIYMPAMLVLLGIH